MLEEVQRDVLKLVELYEKSQKDLHDAAKRMDHLQRQIREKNEQIEKLNKQLKALSVAVLTSSPAGDGSMKVAETTAQKEIKRLVGMLDSCIASLSK